MSRALARVTRGIAPSCTHGQYRKRSAALDDYLGDSSRPQCTTFIFGASTSAPRRCVVRAKQVSAGVGEESSRPERRAIWEQPWEQNSAIPL